MDFFLENYALTSLLSFFQFEDLKFSQYNGQVQPRQWPYDDTTWTDVDMTPPAFSVTFDSNGLFSSLNVPASATLFHRNLFRSWAAQLQVRTIVFFH